MFFLILLTMCSVDAKRDPFISLHASTRYSYIAMGYIHGNNEGFAVLAIDGGIYQVRKGQKVIGHEVVKFTKELLVLKDERGSEHILPLKKIPSTRELKG